MSTLAVVREELTPASVWQAVAGAEIGDELLEWPPDLFALTDAVLERSEAYRFALSPPRGAQWPPARVPGWPGAVIDAARRWSGWVEDHNGAVPDLLAAEWEVFRDGSGIPLDHLREADEWRICEALLTLHAIADEACAGLGVALDAADGEGVVYRARGRELLARTGSLARIPTQFIRVLPRLRTPPDGTSLRSLSRYASRHGPGVEVRWHKVLGRRPGTRYHDKWVNRLLLPWPLRVRESDFRPVEDSVQGLVNEPYGFFEFAPSEGLDFDLVDRMLVAANDEVGQVNVVVLPESAVDHSEVEELEALLSHHGVIGLITGVRSQSQGGGSRIPAFVKLQDVTPGGHDDGQADDAAGLACGEQQGSGRLRRDTRNAGRTVIVDGGAGDAQTSNSEEVSAASGLWDSGWVQQFEGHEESAFFPAQGGA